MNDQQSGSFGCLGIVLTIFLLGAIISGVEKCSSFFEKDQEGFEGPIPVRFQGAYNGYACGGGHVESMVTIGGEDIHYGSAIFKVASVVSEDEGSVTLLGEPYSVGVVEPERTFTIVYAPVGGTARLDGDQFIRCSQY